MIGHYFMRLKVALGLARLWHVPPTAAEWAAAKAFGCLWGAWGCAAR